MKIAFTDTNTGTCEDTVYFSDGNKGEIKFSFVWDESSQSFPKITDGELEDRFGKIARFSRHGGAGSWELFCREYSKEVSKILADTLAVLRVRLTNEVIRVY